jgi:hypothetical protein
MPALRGVYVFGDYCSGEVFGLVTGKPSGGGPPQVLLSTDLSIASFGQDQAGDLYVVGHGGTVHRIVAARVSR